MAFLSSTLSSARSWVRRQQLRAEHKATLKAYREGNFHYPHAATISIGDALHEGLLDMNALQHESFVRFAPSLDERVWNAWNEHSAISLETYQYFYNTDAQGVKTRFSDVYKKLMPFERLVAEAIEQNQLPFLKWLRALEHPWSPVDWQPAQFLGRSIEMGEWALTQFKTLNLTSAESKHLAQQYLWHPEDTPRIPSSLNWMRSPSMQLFYVHHWPLQPPQQEERRQYIAKVFDTILPPQEWPWERRWKELGSYTRVGSYMRVADPPYEWGGRLIPTHRAHGALLAALMHQAPENVQMAMCALKDAVHPNEPIGGHPDPQYIRQHFFEGPPPDKAPSALISTTFLFVGGIDPSVEGEFVLEQIALGNTPQPAPESYELPSLDV